ncbi:MAG: hypothetical protein GY816_10280, partial [Cytophagales bacterium]|nr:hypothetical protein [Cytophagales bacterium]
MKPTICDNEIINDSHYKLFRNDRSAKTHPPDPNNPNKFRRNGGGVLVAIRSDIECSSKSINIGSGAEMLAIELTFPDKTKFVIFTCYRVGTLGFENHNIVTKALQSILKKRKPAKVYIIGDFNLAATSWQKSSPSSSVPIEQQFIDSFNQFGLQQMIRCPTHSGGNTLDILLSNFDASISELNVMDKDAVCKADHFSISFNINKKIHRRKFAKRKFYNFKKANWDKLNHDLSHTDWSRLDSCDIDDGWAYFKSSLLKLVDRYIPKVTIKNEMQAPWFDSEAHQAYRRKERLRRKLNKALSSNDPVKVLKCDLKFNLARTEFKDIAAQKMKDNLFEEDNPALITKKFWSHVKSNSKSIRIPECINYKEQLCFNPLEQANMFNKFFSDQFSGASKYDTHIDFNNDDKFDILILTIEMYVNFS